MARVPLVVADGGSRDATRVVVRALQPRLPGLRLIDNTARLQSAAINRVADTAGGRRYLVRCDAHATYPPGYVRRVVETLAALPEDVASVTTVMDARGDTAFARAAAWAVDTPLGSGGAGHRGGRASGFVDHGHHAGFRLAWLARVGGYDESFAINEDAELDHRLRAAGARIWLDATLRLGYAMRPTPTALARQYWRYGRGRAATVLKHRTRPRLRQLAPAGLVLALGTSLAAAPAFPSLLALPAAYAAVLATAAVAACYSLRSPGGLWAAPALAILHTAWGAGFLARIATGSRRSAEARAASSATVATPGA
jgi:succinoglycan biosynthesis protein ExoA